MDARHLPGITWHGFERRGVSNVFDATQRSAMRNVFDATFSTLPLGLCHFSVSFVGVNQISLSILVRISP